MEQVISQILASPLTPTSLIMLCIAAIIVSFARGWLVSSFQVKQLLNIQNLRIAEAIKRGDDWEAAYRAEVAAHAVTRNQLDQLQVVATTVDKILGALPDPRRQGTTL